MSHTFNSRTDKLLHQDDTLRCYYKPLGQPVYVIEPTHSEPRGVVLFVHGLSEHAFRFFHLGRHWADRGFQTILLHLHGHGGATDNAESVHWLAEAYLSESDPAKLIERFDHCTNDQRQAIEQLSSDNLERTASLQVSAHVEQVVAAAADLASTDRSADTPLFIAGHSLGGLVACESGWQLGVNGPLHPRGVILFSPALRAKAPPQTGIVGRLVTRLSWAAKRNNATVAARLAGWMLNVLTCIDVKLPSVWSSPYVSDLPDQQRLHATDPLIARRLRLHYLKQIELQMAITVERDANYPTDILVFAAADDLIVDASGAVAFVQAVMKHRGKSSRLVVYDNFFSHDLSRSSKRREVLDNIARWMDEVIANPACG